MSYLKIRCCHLQRTPGNYGKSFRMCQQLFQENILLVAGLFQLLIKVYDICIDQGVFLVHFPFQP